MNKEYKLFDLELGELQILFINFYFVQIEKKFLKSISI